MNKPFLFIVGKPHTISAQIRHIAAQLDAMRGQTVPAIRCGGPHDGRSTNYSAHCSMSPRAGAQCANQGGSHVTANASDLALSRSSVRSGALAFDGRHVGEQDADGFLKEQRT